MNRILSMKRRFRDYIRVPKGVCQFAVMILSFIVKPYSVRGGREGQNLPARTLNATLQVETIWYSKPSFIKFDDTMATMHILTGSSVSEF